MRVGSSTNKVSPAALPGPDADEEDRRYLKFYLGGHAFAVPLSLLSEVLRPPPIARVPLAPACLLGLANLRGTVLPVLDIRPSLNLPALASPSARILVLNLGRAVGCLVDRVVNVMEAESETEAALTDATILDKTLLRHAIREGSQIAFTLDFEALLAREFPQASAAALKPAETTAVSTSASHNLESDAQRLISFCVAGQDYALPIAALQAIIALPEKVVRIPKAPPSVLGVIHLQNNLLPLFHLQTLLGLPSHIPDANVSSRVIVVDVLIDGQLQRAGLVVDKVSEVVQVAPESLRPVPVLLGQTTGTADVSAIYQAETDERLFGVLSVQALFAAEQTQNVWQHLREAKTVENHPDAQITETLIVVVRLLDEEFGLAISGVEEIVRVPVLEPVPKAPKFVLGVMNLRGAVVPIFNPRQRLGMADNKPHSAQRILIVSWQGERTGILVDGVSAVLPVPDADFEITPQFTHPHAHLVQHVAHLADGRMLLLLDLARLLDEEAMRALTGVV